MDIELELAESYKNGEIVFGENSAFRRAKDGRFITRTSKGGFLAFQKENQARGYDFTQDDSL